MKKILLCSLYFLFTSIFLQGQDKIEFIDVEAITTNALKEIENDNIDKALELFNKINKSDSSYYELSVTRSYYLLNSDRNEEAIKILDEALNSNYTLDRASFFYNKCIAQHNLEKKEAALKTIEKGLKEYPKNASLWYYKGNILLEQEKTKAAIEAFQKSILYQPSYSDPHLSLGDIYYKQERISQALMCYNTYLLLNPDGENSFKILQLLNEFAKSKNKNQADPTIEQQLEESFNDLDLIINNRIALDKSYEIDFST